MEAALKGFVLDSSKRGDDADIASVHLAKETIGRFENVDKQTAKDNGDNNSDCG